MEWVETTGRTVEEAKDAALDELGVDETDAEFQVLEEPKQGLFGRLRSEARVRARVRPTRPRPKEEADRRRRRRGGRGARGGDAEQLDQRDQKAPAREAGKDTTTDRPATAGSDEEGAPMAETREEQAEVARDFVEGLIEAFGLEAEVTVRTLDDETTEIRAQGPDLGILIGPRGATLNALQELTRTVVQRHSPAPAGRLVVDVAGYREKRREALERFARQLAEEVARTGERKALEPMVAADRKVVHDTVNAIDGVRTVSEGEDPRRRVVILPES